MTSSQKNNVLFVTRRFPPSVGGMERFAFDLYSALSGQVKTRLISWGGKNRYLALFMMPIFFIRSCWALLSGEIDIIHMQDGVLSVMGAILKFIFRKPLAVVIHGLDITYENKLYQAVVPRALKRADHIFCISNAARDEVIKRGVDPGKVTFHPLGITDDLFEDDKVAARQRLGSRLAGINEKTKIILSVGRLVKRKGVHWFILNVMPELVAADSNVMLVVSGDGDYKEQTEAAIQKAKMGKYVRLLGRVDDSYLKDLYNGSDIFVMPNITVAGDMEGFGRVLLEAAVCELPVIASGIEGIKDAIINGKNGILVNEQDTVGFIEASKKFLEDKQAAADFGRRSRKYTLKNYSWDVIADAFVRAYSQAIT